MQIVQRFVERLTLSDCTGPALALALTTVALLVWSILAL
jgi:hypothetical protein